MNFLIVRLGNSQQNPIFHAENIKIIHNSSENHFPHILFTEIELHMKAKEYHAEETCQYRIPVIFPKINEGLFEIIRSS